MISSGRFPLDLEVENTKTHGNKKIITTKSFKPIDYLGHSDLLEDQKVKHVVEMDKPPLFVGNK
eukprot:gene6365-9291_t